jgi:hypothetical protein
MPEKNATKKEEIKKGKIKGSWFNVLLCLAIFAFVFLVEASFVDMFLQKSKLTKLPEIIGFAISVAYSAFLLIILAGGAVFNFVSTVAYSHFKSMYDKYSFLVWIDNALDWALWYLAFWGTIAGFLLNVAIVELVLKW